MAVSDEFELTTIIDFNILRRNRGPINLRVLSHRNQTASPKLVKYVWGNNNRLLL